MYVSPRTAETFVGSSPSRACGGRELEHGGRRERTQIVGSGCLRAVSAPGQGRAHGVLRPIPPRSGGIRAAAPGEAHVSFVTVKKPLLRLKSRTPSKGHIPCQGIRRGSNPIHAGGIRGPVIRGGYVRAHRGSRAFTQGARPFAVCTLIIYRRFRNFTEKKLRTLCLHTKMDHDRKVFVYFPLIHIQVRTPYS